MTREQAIRAVGQASKRIGLLHHAEPFVDALVALGVLKCETDEDAAYLVIEEQIHQGMRGANGWPSQVITDHVKVIADRVMSRLKSGGFKIVRDK